MKEERKRLYLLAASNLGENTDTLLCEAIRRFFEKNYDVRVTFEVFPQGYNVVIEKVPLKIKGSEEVPELTPFQSKP